MAIYYPKGRGTTPQFSEARIIDPKVGNISLLATLGGFLNNKKRIFGPTKTLFGQTYKWPFLRISGRDHVLCHCGSFFMAQTVPPSLVNQSPKIRVLILAKLEWPEMAKNRGEPWKMTHSPVNFFVLELQFSSTGHITSVPGATAFPFEPPKKFCFRAMNHFPGLTPVFGHFGLVSLR